MPSVFFGIAAGLGVIGPIIDIGLGVIELGVFAPSIGICLGFVGPIIGIFVGPIIGIFVGPTIVIFIAIFFTVELKISRNRFLRLSVK